MKKTVAVLGGGNGAHAIAADLALQGHRVRMYYRTRKAPKVFETRQIRVSGVINGTASLELVTDNLKEAVTGADYIILITPAYAHETYAKLLKGLLLPSQLLLVLPGAFAALQFRSCWEDNECPILLESNNLPYGTRMAGEGHVMIHNRNPLNVAFLPSNAGPSLIEEVKEVLSPIHIQEVLPDVLACSLSLMNPVIHPGSCLVNISNIERPDVNFFLYEHGFTPSAAKLSRALDQERIRLAKALGYDLHPVSDNRSLPVDYTWQQLYMAFHGDISHSVIQGPNDLQNRYLTEDVPCGLVPWAAIADAAGVEVPLMKSVIQIYNTVHETDWNRAGLSSSKLGLHHLDFTQPDKVRTYLQSGKR